jgi:hypothetical protein
VPSRLWIGRRTFSSSLMVILAAEKGSLISCTTGMLQLGFLRYCFRCCHSINDISHMPSFLQILFAVHLSRLCPGILLLSSESSGKCFPFSFSFSYSEYLYGLRP